jgi:hypothetical protein
MKTQTHTKVMSHTLAAGVLSIGFVFFILAPPALACDRQKSTMQEQHVSTSTNETSGEKGTAATAVQPAAGMRVFVDPQTGKVVAPPPGTPAESQAPDLSTSSEGLTETRLPGGGAKVDLQGRFQTPLVATVGADGKVSIDHKHATAGEKQ